MHALQMGNAPCGRHADHVAIASTASSSPTHAPEEADLCTFNCRCTRASDGSDPREAFDESMTVEAGQDSAPLPRVPRRAGHPPAVALAGRSRARALSRQMHLVGEVDEEVLEPKTIQLGFAKSYHAASAGPLPDRAFSGHLRALLQFGRLASQEVALKGQPIASNPVVTLNIYDVGTCSIGRALNSVLRHFGTGAFHCGVAVFGCEWSFSDTEDGNGMGVFCSPPRCCDSHTYCESVKMGRTSMTRSEVLKLIRLMSSYWPVADYDTLTRNCCHFCDEMCQRLCVGPIPSWVMNLAGAGAALAATGDATCCRQVAREMFGTSAVDKLCCVAPGLRGDAIMYHL